jgi:hypothetical protein
MRETAQLAWRQAGLLREAIRPLTPTNRGPSTPAKRPEPRAAQRDKAPTREGAELDS